MSTRSPVTADNHPFAQKSWSERGSADLRPEHIEYLRKRACTDPQYLRLAGVRSGVAELIFTYFDPETGSFYLDFARAAPFPRPRRGKFKQPARSANHLYFTPIGDKYIDKAVLENTALDFYLCEGETRALALGQRGYFAGAIGGLNSHRTRTPDGLSRYLPEFDLIDLRNRTVVICLDHDATAPEAATQKRRALADIYRMVETKGGRPKFVQLPALTPDEKTGLDDFIAVKGIKAFMDLDRHDFSEEEFREWERGGTFTDRENAERFARLFSDRARYVPELQSWILWDGSRWVPDDANTIWQLGCELADDWRLTARELQNPEDRKRQRVWADKCESLGVIKSAVSLASSNIEMHTRLESLDRHPFLLGVRNGVIDLTTGKLIAQPDRSLYLTKAAPVEFDPKARCPEFLAFMKRTFKGRPEVISYLRRAIGYTLTGNTREQCFFICWGSGSNGKGTLNRVLRKLLGKFHVESDVSTWAQRADYRAGAAREDLMALRGARFVSVDEPGRGFRVDESLIKSVTGEDQFSARPLYGKQTEFTPECKIFIFTNHKPVMAGDDRALWRRVHFVPFLERFEGKAKVLDLNERLAGELPGILNWAIQGCLEWQQSGLSPPADVTNATEEYRKEQDRFGQFLEDETETAPAYWESTDALYTAYEGWCRRNGVRFPVIKGSFHEPLKSHGFQPFSAKSKGKKHRGWRGLRLTEDAKERTGAKF